MAKSEEALDDDGELGPDPREGQIIGGKYRLVRRLAAGGMGTVYEARHVELGGEFAVKILHIECARKPRLLRRFVREAKIVGALANEHVARVVESGASAGQPYFVMELLRGQDLGQLLRQTSPLPITRAANIIIGACRGLIAAHAAGLVHRDLKPANVFITRLEGGGEVAKVLDFGVAKLRDTAETTAEGTLIGTVGYMAPEQVIAGRDVDQRADIYSLGIILYEALSGEPFRRGTKAEVLFQSLYAEPPSLRSRGRDVPLALERVLGRALARDPERRYQSVVDLARDLEPFADSAATAAVGFGDVLTDDNAAKVVATTDMSAVERRPRARPVRASRRRMLSMFMLAGVAVLAWVRASDFHGVTAAGALARPGDGAPQLAPSPAPASPLANAGEVEALSSVPLPAAQPANAARTAAVRRERAEPRSTSPARPLLLPGAQFDAENPYAQPGRRLRGVADARSSAIHVEHHMSRMR